VRAVVASTGASGLPEVAGNTWAFLQYVVGFDRLGVQSFWIDHQAKLDPRRPARDRRAQPHEDCHSIDYVERRFRQTARDFGFEDRWCIVYDGGARHIGMSAGELESLVEEADVLINLGGPLPPQSPLLRIRCRVYVDLDPGFTQIWAHQIDMGFRDHDFFFSVGQNVGRADFKIPTPGVAWEPTFPPIVLDLWPAHIDAECERLSTIADWHGSQYARFGNDLYQGKREEFLRFLDVPRRARRPVEIALSMGQHDHEDLGLLLRNDWFVRDPYLYAGDLDSYREFIRFSRAEFSVAKSGYVRSGCGWLSDRTASYLACGKPAVVQSTGFEWRLPTGEGLITFRTVEEAVEALATVEHDYMSHARAARALAEQQFDSAQVLGSMLQRAGL
jgi:hypothetical protein